MTRTTNMNGQVVLMFSAQQVRPGIWVGFTDAETGNLAFHVIDDPAAVAQRRAVLNARLSDTAGTAVELAYMNQVHGNAVADIAWGGTRGGTAVTGGTVHGGAVRGGAPVPTADAMVSTGAGLAVMVADCVPVVLVGDGTGGGTVLAVAHAGRPGVDQDVVGAVVARMREAGGHNLEAWLGPSICGQCYEVPEAMRAAVAHTVPESFSDTSWGTPALDLPAAVLAQLRANNVTAHPSGECTLENPGYQSHRRAVRDGSAEGRFIGFAVSAH